ncbi:hypothetical protein [Floridanema aerugineum]|uniref:PEP-CTERM sorting domain-containing protein n=1 Tax=Floridaenema aerugineum BLCC-F46 TaxID=3153654 RepID=A0ABV4WZR4_9CYAN
MYYPNWFKTLWLALILGVLWNPMGVSASAAVLGENLIANGNAEQGGCDNVGNAIGNAIPAIPGWVPTGNFSVLCYGATGFQFVNPFGQTVQVSGLPDATMPGPSDRGTGLFFGGGDRASSSASQLIDLTDLASVIDAGQGFFDLSAWLGGYTTDADSPSLNVSFLSDTNQSLGNVSLTAPTATERNNQTGLFLKSLNGFLPVGTRQARVQLDMNYVRGRVNDAYADNLSLVVNKVPDPSMGVFSLLSVAGMLFWRSRRSHSQL